MKVSAIVATAKNNVIGKDNDIPWYLPADLKYFKRVTLGHHIIMGRKCFESIGRPLPKRTNIIITRNTFFTASNALICHSLEDAFSIALDNGEEEVFVIGGGEIYRQAMPFVDKIYLTEVDLVIEGTVFFPDLSMNDWKLVTSESHQADAKNEYDYVFKTYEKIVKEEEE